MNYFDTDNRKFAKEFVDYGVFSTDDTLPYKASEESAMGEYVHPLKDMRSIKLHKIKDKSIDSMKKNTIRLTESQLHNVIKESINRVLNESIEDQEARINAAVEALISIRDVVSRAASCWEYGDVNEPLFQQICKASAAIHGVLGFSHYGETLRRQAEIEMHEQD